MKGIQKGYAVHPFMMYLPFPISYRKRKRPLSHKISEKLVGAGLYPIQLMEIPQIERLLERNPVEAPFAEYFLNVEGLNGKQNWTYVGGVSALHAQGGFKALIGKFLNLFHYFNTSSLINSK